MDFLPLFIFRLVHFIFLGSPRSFYDVLYYLILSPHVSSTLPSLINFSIEYPTSPITLDYINTPLVLDTKQSPSSLISIVQSSPLLVLKHPQHRSHPQSCLKSSLPLPVCYCLSPLLSYKSLVILFITDISPSLLVV